MKTIRVGNAAGFWGDNLDAPRLLAEAGRLDYLTLEYLAELTLSILAHQKRKNPELGYATDFPQVLETLLPSLQKQPRLVVVTNAGGMNPLGCARAAAQILAAAGMPQTAVAAVTGDDILTDLPAHRDAGEQFQNLDSGQALSELDAEIVSANVYLGAAGIVAALAHPARIVVTGRVADASLTLGPAVHEFGWSWDDWYRLAAATGAGHLIECGAQVTGGFFSGWTPQLELSDVGYPIAELSADGSVVITKPEGSGGRVTSETVAEQLVYEIGDPAHYLTPDVDADFSAITLSELDADRVAVNNARGQPAPATYKVSIAFNDGYKSSGMLVINGRQAVAKARACAQIVFERVRRAGYDLQQTHVECLGAGDSLPGVVPIHPQRRGDFSEVVLRVSAHDSRIAAIERFTRELAPLVTSGPPGVTGYTGARPRPQTVYGFWPASMSRSRVDHRVLVKTAKEWNS